MASISVQPEVVTHLHRTLSMIRAGGCEAGWPSTRPPRRRSIEWALPYLDYVNVMSVNPGFGGQAFIPEMADKVRRLKEMTDLPIQVDGGITAGPRPLMVEAGAQVLVAGSAVFRGDRATEMRRISRPRRRLVATRRSSNAVAPDTWRSASLVQRDRCVVALLQITFGGG